jgi:hypothetical protein
MMSQPVRREVFGQSMVTVRWMRCSGCRLARVMSWSYAGPAETARSLDGAGEPDDVEAHGLAQVLVGG